MSHVFPQQSTYTDLDRGIVPAAGLGPTTAPERKGAMKQPVLRTLAITCTMLLLAACQAGPLAGKRNTVPVSTKPESSTLRIAYVGTAFENAALDYVITCYEKAHPDRSIERVNVAAENQAALPLTVRPMFLAVNVDGLSSAGIPLPAKGGPGMSSARYWPS